MWNSTAPRLQAESLIVIKKNTQEVTADIGMEEDRDEKC